MVSLGDVKRSAATLYAQGQHLAALRLYDAVVSAAPLDYDARIRVADCALALGDANAEPGQLTIAEQPVGLASRGRRCRLDPSGCKAWTALRIGGHGRHRYRLKADSASAQAWISVDLAPKPLEIGGFCVLDAA